MIKVLVVDDSALVRKLLGQAFAGEGDFEVAFARDGVAALAELARFNPDVVTLDVNMPLMDGLACLDRIMIERPCPVVMVSSATGEGAEATLEALRLGAVDFVAKPDGAMSLQIEAWIPTLLRTVRTAAGAKPRLSRRLRERVRHRMRGSAPAGLAPPAAPRLAAEAAPIEGLAHGLVLVGASTGGPPALETLLRALPSSFPWPILVAQHMPVAFTGPFAKRLDGLCALSVAEVGAPVRLRPGAVHIGRGNADLVVTRRSGELFAMAAPAQPGYPWHPSVDRLVRSAMEQAPASRLVGLLLTGMGTDGADAMAAMRHAGGRTIAEAEETAVVWGMPGSLARLGGADRILPLPRIADCLIRWTAKMD
ncbi:chemotaxis-specific protein-glutamate methyltransferase CheB [Labrys monachus]|uniref:Protein-glutamate methylesterase/protein-glutamine glutaminase n=1 Tax=Labrys monachus TaxID=217067 RepID=A0ABU0FLP5_9HYPH|nr:chemotaxis-specific protein-glutamate methyltransferase CheB [Labrys monachus]MDQ0395528.1 two-component system chemotaxis response regulator CheB [Labrys monachus]